MFYHDDNQVYPLGKVIPDPRAAKWLLPLIEHLLGTAMGLICLRHSMPWRDGRELLLRAGTEALSQFELACELFEALTNNLCAQDLVESGLSDHYIRHTAGIEPCCTRPLPISGDPVTDIHSAIARAQCTRTQCDNLLRVIDDPATIGVVLYVRERQLDMAAKFCTLLGEVKAALTEQGVYAYNPAFDVCEMGEK